MEGHQTKPNEDDVVIINLVGGCSKSCSCFHGGSDDLTLNS